MGVMGSFTRVVATFRCISSIRLRIELMKFNEVFEMGIEGGRGG